MDFKCVYDETGDTNPLPTFDEFITFLYHEMVKIERVRTIILNDEQKRTIFTIIVIGLMNIANNDPLPFAHLIHENKGIIDYSKTNMVIQGTDMKLNMVIDMIYHDLVKYGVVKNCGQLKHRSRYTINGIRIVYEPGEVMFKSTFSTKYLKDLVANRSYLFRPFDTYLRRVPSLSLNYPVAPNWRVNPNVNPRNRVCRELQF